uniref:FH2 domain-containing protein n=1 Tax=Elaeophora elaphi TaxID=1147741 RepID=A0A158Q909_9BILA
MPANDGTERKPLSSSPLQQQAQMSLHQQLDLSVDASSGTVTTTPTTTPSALNAEFFHCLTQNLLATTAAGTSGQPQATDAATGASVAAAFGLPIPDVSMMYGNEEPISHMEEYADEVEQLMKRCFPTVRGRGRPVHSNIRPSTASSSSTVNTESNNNSSRNSANSIASVNKISARYTHSYRRRGIKHPVQEMTHEIYSSVSNKRVKNENDYENESEIAINQAPIDASGQSSPSEEDSSSTSNVPHNGIKETYSKNISYSHGTNSYYDRNGTNDYNDEVNKYRSSTGYQNGTDQSETVANDSSPSSSEHVNNEAELETESNDSSVHDFDEEEQPLGYIDHIRPRYLPQNVNWWILANDQLKGTIFESFQLSEVLHRFPRQPYKLDSKFFVTQEQLKRVQEVRQQLTLDLTKLRDALCNLDLSVLPTEQVDLIANIAPTSMDVFYLLDCESADPTALTGGNEQFLLELAKIDRIEEKLHAMSFMGHINSRVTEILKSFEDLTNIVKVLKKNRGFRALLRVVLVLMNFIIGDFTARTIRGFRASDLAKICATEVCNSPKTTLLNIVASSTISEFPEVCIFRDTLPALERASRVRRLERDYLRFDREASRLDDKGQMAGYREVIRNKVMEVKDSYRECKIGLCKTMRFFGELVDEDIGPEIPETFFASIATFYRQLQRAWIDVHLHGIPVTKAV